MLEALFRDSGEAINDSIKEGVVLAVYNTARDDQWLKVDTLAEHSIWLRLVKDTEQFQLFEQEKCKRTIAETTLEIQRREQLKQRKLAEEGRERIIRLVSRPCRKKALMELHHRTLDDDKPLDVHDYIKTHKNCNSK
nr:CLL_HP1_G0004510.mRNA.1.CDS.1 [Saccharomyces cerevisiae]